MLDLDGYANDGYLVVGGLIDRETADSLARERQRFADRQALSVELQLVHRSEAIRDFAIRGPQIALAVEVLGPNVCFTHQQFVTKAPGEAGGTDIPWHQDSGYGRLEPPSDLTVWIALDDTDEGNGCLWVLPGSHRDGLRPHRREGGLMGAAVEETGFPVPMARGDALLFSGHLLHRSLPNTSGRARHALYLRYCTPDVVMVSAGGRPVLEDGFSWMVAGEAPHDS